MRGLPSALFFISVACGVMKGLKNCLFVFEFDSAPAAAFAPRGQENMRVADYNSVLLASHALM
jgi:hypothetical protein